MVWLKEVTVIQLSIRDAKLQADKSEFTRGRAFKEDIAEIGNFMSELMRNSQ